MWGDLAESSLMLSPDATDRRPARCGVFQLQIRLLQAPRGRDNHRAPGKEEGKSFIQRCRNDTGVVGCPTVLAALKTKAR